jgi:hypothetical protein
VHREFYMNTCVWIVCYMRTHIIGYIFEWIGEKLAKRKTPIKINVYVIDYETCVARVSLLVPPKRTHGHLSNLNFFSRQLLMYTTMDIAIQVHDPRCCNVHLAALRHAPSQAGHDG